MSERQQYCPNCGSGKIFACDDDLQDMCCGHEGYWCADCEYIVDFVWVQVDGQMTPVTESQSILDRYEKKLEGMSAIERTFFWTLNNGQLEE